jgi:hypothetical protein
MQLDELYKDRDWQGFADLFLELYFEADAEQQLIYIRELTIKWRHNAIYSYIIYKIL